MIRQSFAGLAFALALPSFAAAQDVLLDTADGRGSYAPGEEITLTYRGEPASPMDYLVLEDAEGAPIESRVLPPDATVRGSWRLSLSPGEYTVRWASPSDPKRAWNVVSRDELALQILADDPQFGRSDRGIELEPLVIDPPSVRRERRLTRRQIEELVRVPPSTRDRWATYVDEDYGTSIAYPADMFAPVESDGTPGQEFASIDGRARFGVYAGPQSETLNEMRSRFLNDPSYGRITYSPKGNTWFVLSGQRDGYSFYEKYFVRGGRMHAFAFEFPPEQRPLYAPVLERMEDSFRSG